MPAMSDLQIAEMASLDDTVVDGVAEVALLGPMVVINYFRWVPETCRNGITQNRRQICLRVKMPADAAIGIPGVIEQLRELKREAAGMPIPHPRLSLAG